MEDEYKDLIGEADAGIVHKQQQELIKELEVQLKAKEETH
jgi:hypothetical protein